MEQNDDFTLSLYLSNGPRAKFLMEDHAPETRATVQPTNNRQDSQHRSLVAYVFLKLLEQRICLWLRGSHTRTVMLAS